MEDMMILTPDGIGVNLNEIRAVTIIVRDASKLSFRLYYKGLDCNTVCEFRYYYSQYTDSREELIKKVENIRMEIMRCINNGTPVSTINGSINIKKLDGN